MTDETCTARIRPFPPDTDPPGTELACSEEGRHSEHQAVLRDYAYPGSATTIHWYESDRRNFHGEWPGHCMQGSKGPCTLPINHPGRCAY